MALTMAFSRFPTAQSAAEINFENLFSVDIPPVVEYMWPSNATPLSLGTHLEMWLVYRGHKFIIPRGFYLGGV
jgi:hypothetical protein